MYHNLFMPPKKRRVGTALPEEPHEMEHRLELKQEELKTAPDHDRSETDSSQQRTTTKQHPKLVSVEKSKNSEGKDPKIDQKEGKDSKAEPAGSQGKKRTFEEAGGMLNTEKGEKGQKKQNGKKKDSIIMSDTVDDPQILEQRIKKFGTSEAIDDSIPAIYREPLPVRHERKTSKPKRHPTRPLKRRHNNRDNRDNRDNRNKRDNRDNKNKEKEANPEKEKPVEKEKEVKADNQLPPQPRRFKPKREQHESYSVRRRHNSRDEHPRHRNQDRDYSDRYDRQREQRDREARDRQELERYRERDPKYRSDRDRHDYSHRRYSPPNASHSPPRRPYRR